MVGLSGTPGIGVIVKSTSASATEIAIDKFVYDGINNTFALTDAATKVLDVYIDNGVYPDEVPAGAQVDVTITPALLLAGNKVTIKYQK